MGPEGPAPTIGRRPRADERRARDAVGPTTLVSKLKLIYVNFRAGGDGPKNISRAFFDRATQQILRVLLPLATSGVTPRQHTIDPEDPHQSLQINVKF